MSKASSSKMTLESIALDDFDDFDVYMDSLPNEPSSSIEQKPLSPADEEFLASLEDITSPSSVTLNDQLLSSSSDDFDDYMNSLPDEPFPITRQARLTLADQEFLLSLEDTPISSTTSLKSSKRRRFKKFNSDALRQKVLNKRAALAVKQYKEKK